MSVKSILCIFGGVPEELDALNTAFALAELHQAQVRFLHIAPNLPDYIGIYGGAAVIDAAILNAFEKENRVRLQRARNHVKNFAAKHHVALDVPATPQHHVAARFVHRTGFIADIVAEEGQLSDMIVISRGIAAPETADDPHVLAALFNTGRPVILVPVAEHPVMKPWQDRNVAIAWDHQSPELSRALYYALPYLERAEMLYILAVHEDRETHDPGAMRGVMDYLQTHVSGAPQLVLVNRKEDSVARVLLRQAHALKIDLLVMGAFGHSRLREMLVGGTTRTMLEKADLPLLLAH